MAVITTKQHDTKIRFSDRPEIDGQRVLYSDMSGCTLSFILKSETVLIKAPAVIDSEIVGADTLTLFTYDPVATDVEEIGDFQQEWEVVYPSGKILTFPNTVYNSVKIIADLG